MKALRHAGITVSDLERSLRFYRDLLGLRLVKKMDEAGSYIDVISGLKRGAVTTVKLSAEDSSLIELLYYHFQPRLRQKKVLSSIGASHVAFTVDDIDKEYSRLLAEGIKFNSSPQVSPDGYAKVAFCQDPDGVFVELVQVLEKK